MATAVEPSSQPRTPNTHTKLALASLAGAVYVLAALAVVFFALPSLWAEHVTPQFVGFSFVNAALRWTVQLAALVGLAVFGQKLAGDHPPVGIRGGIFLVISAAITIFFLVRAVGMNVDGSIGQIVTAIVGAALLFVTVRWLTSARGERRMVALEEQGWFGTHSYKGSLGKKVRRITMLGIGLVGGSGIAALQYHGQLPQTWTLALPFTEDKVKVVDDLPNAATLVLALMTWWVAYRVVNIPTFAEFLIATEAEMNKVSWTSRKQLVQDTAVVLITTFLLTLFLLVVDLFWGTVLSWKYIGVLPGKSDTKDKAGQVQEAKW